jgi:hypothetical protein
VADAVRDRYLGKVALEKGFLTEGQLQRALEVQKALSEKGEDQRLDSVLLEHEFLSRDQIVEVRIGAKERYFNRLYKKVKEQEARERGEEQADPQESSSPKEDSPKKKGTSPRLEAAKKKGTSPRLEAAKKKGTSPRLEAAKKKGTSPRLEAAKKKGTSPRLEAVKKKGLSASGERPVQRGMGSSTEREVGGRGRRPTGRHRRPATRKTAPVVRKKSSGVPMALLVGGLFILSACGITFLMDRSGDGSSPVGEGASEKTADRLAKTPPESGSAVKAPSRRRPDVSPDEDGEREMESSGPASRSLLTSGPGTSYRKEVKENPESKEEKESSFGPGRASAPRRSSSVRNPDEEGKRVVEVSSPEALKLLREIQALLAEGDRQGVLEKIQELRTRYPDEPITRYIEEMLEEAKEEKR